MWIARKFSDQRREELEGAMTDMGVTTIGGGAAAVLTRGEQRDLETFSPGGVIWQPQAGDTVLVARGGVGCQEQCVLAAGSRGKEPEGMVPGELYLYAAEGGSIYLKSDGSIAISGPVEIKGDVKLVGRVDIIGSLFINGIPYRPCVCLG